MIRKINANLSRLVAMLSDGHYHDGNTIGQALQMTRSAVWKAMKKLMAYGVRMDAVKGKGYALLEPLLLLDADKIHSALVPKKVELLLFETLESTNDYVKSSKPTKSIKICIAEQQTRGKGRLNREWHSPFGANIYLSCGYPCQKDISELAGLSLVTGLALLQGLKPFHRQDQLQVKWPNDIVCGDKKLAGTLIEIQAETHGASYAVIGIGVNVNMVEDKSSRIAQPWASLRTLSGDYMDRNEVCASIINQLIQHLQQFEAQGFAPFKEAWMAHDYLLDKTISIQSLNQVMTGQVVGINEQGHLLMALANGQVRAFSSGDTTIIKPTMSSVV